MSSRINHIIQPRAFEFIRDRIGNILKEELDNQFNTYAVQEAKALVTIEGDKIVDSTEMATILVALNEGNLDSDHPGSSRGAMFFNIDCFCNAKSTDVADGAILASLKLQRLVGLVWAILSDEQYSTLGFAPPFIANRGVRKIKIGDPNEKDSLCSISARLIFEVTANETTELFVPRILEGYQTKIIIGTSTSGYFLNKTI